MRVFGCILSGKTAQNAAKKCHPMLTGEIVQIFHHSLFDIYIESFIKAKILVLYVSMCSKRLTLLLSHAFNACRKGLDIFASVLHLSWDLCTTYGTDGIYVFFYHNCFLFVSVVVQGYQLNVQVMPAVRGCTAVLRCEIPSFVKEWVKVVSWVQDDSIYFYPKHQQGKKKLVILQDAVL